MLRFVDHELEHGGPLVLGIYRHTERSVCVRTVPAAHSVGALAMNSRPAARPPFVPPW
jgi:hypothetical protein